MRKPFVILGLIGLALIVIIAFLTLSTVSRWNQALTSFETRTFEVRRGDSVAAIGSRLVDDGLIGRSSDFGLLVRYMGAAPRLQAGLYEISPGTTLRDFVDMVSRGRSVPDDVSVMVVEGLTVEEMAEVFAESGLFPAEDFVSATLMGPAYRDLELLENLEDGTSLIGYLFPDTYRFRPSESAEQVVRKMLENAARRFDEVGIDSPMQSFHRLRNLHELLTFASIVQKEAPAGDEDLIAGVFANRLRARMRFESDATVNFILNTSKLIPSASDIRVNHPYNTYLIPGLPPGPINSPGLAAISASMNPASHEFYFFLHTPDRVTILSRTFDEHLANRAIYWE